jgi:hypothetical protein
VENFELSNYAEELVASKTRLLALITGCVSCVAGSLPFGPLFSLLPAILVLGAVLQRWSPRPGRWLMWLGAFFLTVEMGLLLGPTVLRPPHVLDTNILIVFTLCSVSLVLVGWCDVALIIDSRRAKSVPDLANQAFPRAADWIIGILALCLTISAVWSILSSFFPLRHYGRLDISLFAIVFGIVVAAFDAAIVAHAVKMYRGRRVETTRNE